MVDNISMLRRNIIDRLLDGLADTPAVLVNGARQTGKSTLVQSVELAGQNRQYLTFDDPGILAAAKRDPNGFVAGLNMPVTLDEVQHVPEIFPVIKAAIDRKRRSGEFLLTGSANVMLLPKLSESLAGRMEVLTLWPFSQGEIHGVQEPCSHRTPSDGRERQPQSEGTSYWRPCWPVAIRLRLPARAPSVATHGFSPTS
jgi:predicted AAA+ superfamily ATPase